MQYGEEVVTIGYLSLENSYFKFAYRKYICNQTEKKLFSFYLTFNWCLGSTNATE